MRERVKLYIHRPLKYFSKPTLEIQSQAIIFHFYSNSFTIKYKELVYYEKHKYYIIMKIKNSVKNTTLVLRICPIRRNALTQIITQLDVFNTGQLCYVTNPLFDK